VRALSSGVSVQAPGFHRGEALIRLNRALNHRGGAGCSQGKIEPKRHQAIKGAGRPDHPSPVKTSRRRGGNQRQLGAGLGNGTLDGLLGPGAGLVSKLGLGQGESPVRSPPEDVCRVSWPGQRAAVGKGCRAAVGSDSGRRCDRHPINPKQFENGGLSRRRFGPSSMVRGQPLPRSRPTRSSGVQAPAGHGNQQRRKHEDQQRSRPQQHANSRILGQPWAGSS